MKRILLGAVLSLVSAAAAVTASAQEAAPRGAPEPVREDAQETGPVPRFEAGVEQVVVDLVVTDRDGEPVQGLGRDDLIVEEDGVPQTIVSFEAVELPEIPAPRPAPPTPVSTNTAESTRSGRIFAIVLDDVHLTPHRARDAKAAVASFLAEGVREGDHVVLMATSGDAWWTTRMPSGRDELIGVLDRIEGRRVFDRELDSMTDWEAMRIHIHRDERVARQVAQRFQDLGVMTLVPADRDNPLTGTTIDPVVTARAREVYFRSRTRSQVTLDALERVLDGLAGIRGRKSVVLVSEGFVDDTTLEEFRRVNLASLRANAAIYFVDARGLEGMPAEFSAQFGPPMAQEDIGFTLSSMSALDDGAEGLAEDSGGFTVKNTNDLDAAIQRIARENRVYYLLGYNSTNTARDGRFRRIDVELREGMRKGREVRARRGYFPPSADAGTPRREDVDPVVQAALDSPWAEDGIPLRMTHYVRGERRPGKAEAVLVTELDVAALDFEPQDGRDVAEIEFLLVVAHLQSGEYFRYDQSVTMRLRPATHERLLREWYPIVRDFDLQPGDHQAKIVVREKSTGLVGSVIHEFSVPPVGEFRVSTPILTDRWRGGAGAALQPQLLARREFAPGSELLCQLEVYGAEKDETGMPRVFQGYEVIGPEGGVFKRLEESLVGTTSLGTPMRVFVLSLDGAPPGDYAMVLRLRDGLSGETRELREPFAVTGAAPPAESNLGSH